MCIHHREMGIILVSLPGWFKCDDICKAIGTVPVGKMNAEILSHLLLQQPYGWGRGGTPLSDEETEAQRGEETLPRSHRVGF